MVFEIVLYFYRWCFLIPWNQLRDIPVTMEQDSDVLHGVIRAD